MGTYGSRQLTLQGCIGCCRLPSNWRVGGGHLGCCFQLFLANFGNCGGYFFFRPAATPPPAWRGQLNASPNDEGSLRHCDDACGCPRPLIPVHPHTRGTVMQQPSSMNVAIAGGGIAGLAAAIALRRSGRNVTMYVCTR